MAVSRENSVAVDTAAVAADAFRLQGHARVLGPLALGAADTTWQRNWPTNVLVQSTASKASRPYADEVVGDG
jgi:hypothetical protein